LKEVVVKPPIADAKKVINSIMNRDKYFFLVIL